MYKVRNTLDNKFEGLTIKKIASTITCETLYITLEEGSYFPEHTSPRDTLLIMLEGTIRFMIKGESYRLSKDQSFAFPSGEKHEVIAIQNAKFLIIR